MMAANAANDGSGRCQPKFISDDEDIIALFYCLVSVRKWKKCLLLMLTDTSSVSTNTLENHPPALPL
jgi:hypothetical protein